MKKKNKGSLGKKWKLEKERQYPFIKCVDCGKRIKQKSPNHLRCATCKKFLLKQMDTLPLERGEQKKTWGKKKPGVISR